MPGEAGGDLRVEDVRDLGLPDAAQQRDVLAPGVEDDLDVRVGEDLGQRTGVELLLDRVEHLDPHAAVGLLDGDLDEAQERAVAALLP